MKLYMVIITLTLWSNCECNLLQSRDGEKDLTRMDLPKIPGIYQFEQVMRLIEKQIYDMSNTVTRILTPNLRSKSDLDDSSNQLREQMRDLENSLQNLRNVLLNLVSRAENENKDALLDSAAKVPILHDFVEYIALMQKQMSGMFNLVTKALTGQFRQVYLQEANQQQPQQQSQSTPIPFLKELEEFIQLFQKQLSRLGETVRRTLTGGN